MIHQLANWIIAVCISTMAIATQPPIPPQPAAPQPTIPGEVHPPGNIFEETKPGDCITKDIVNATAKKEGDKITWVVDSASVIFIRTFIGETLSQSNPFAEMAGIHAPVKIPYADSVAIFQDSKGVGAAAFLFKQDVACQVVWLKDATLKHFLALANKVEK